MDDDPVKRLTPEEIGRSYDAIAADWQAPRLQTNGMVQLRRAVQFVRQRGRALDVGCGSSGRFFDLLLGEGFQVEGIDVSARMVELARERHPEVSVTHADIATWPLPHPYDLIVGWDSIWHLPLADQEPVLRKLCRGLAPGGVLIFTTGGLDAPSEKSDAAMGPTVYYSVLGIPRLLAVLHDSDCVCRHLEYDQYPEQHLFVIAQKGPSPEAAGS